MVAGAVECHINVFNTQHVHLQTHVPNHGKNNIFLLVQTQWWEYERRLVGISDVLFLSFCGPKRKTNRYPRVISMYGSRKHDLRVYITYSGHVRRTAEKFWKKKTTTKLRTFRRINFLR